MASGGVGQATLSLDRQLRTTRPASRSSASWPRDPDDAFAQVGTTAANVAAFTNTSVPGGDYSYRVRATNAVGDSAYSNSATATVTAPGHRTRPPTWWPPREMPRSA